MANPETRERAEESTETNGENGSQDAVEHVVSDRRARRKAKRGEAFVKADDTGSSSAEPQKKDRPTPSRRNAAKATATQQRNIFQRIPIVRSIYNYLAASVTEMRKVTWPNREETTRLTRMVIAIMIFSSIVLVRLTCSMAGGSVRHWTTKRYFWGWP